MYTTIGDVRHDTKGHNRIMAAFNTDSTAEDIMNHRVTAYGISNIYLLPQGVTWVYILSRKLSE